MIKIANCSKLSAAEKQAPNFVYIGRKFAGFEASPLCNPYKRGTREQNIDDFAAFLWHQVTQAPQPNPQERELVRILELEDEYGEVVLGCWCNFPSVDCHGRIVSECARYVEKNA
jgi:hypothetical protein